jgi:hypothetical protein
MNISIQKIAFCAPLVPAAAPMDGLLKTRDLNTPIHVEIQVRDGMRPGYFMQLLLSAELIGPVWVMSNTDNAGDIVTMMIPPEYLLSEGHYALGFRATSHQSQVHIDSDTTPLIVDRTPPGSSLIGPMMVACVSFGSALKGKIPSYAGIEPGDMIQTVCNGSLDPAYRVQPENLTTLPIEIWFSSEFLEGLQSDRVNITYHITDRAGNRSILAQSVELTLQR